MAGKTDEMTRNAVLSDCGKYRYSLTRRWGEGHTVCWIMLNPSTADAEVDDPTIRRCIGFSKAWGAGALEVVNLYAYRATNPKELGRVRNPVGPENGLYLFRAGRDASRVVCAWGTKGGYQAVETKFRLSRQFPDKLATLGLTKDGHPRHPLYVPSAQKPEPWEAVREQ